MGELRIRLLAVGQGDCLILEFPDESLAVIDCGGIPTAASVALAFLNPLLRAGRRLRFVLATHPDKDHVEGIPSLLAGLAKRPDVFYHSGVTRRFRRGAETGNLRYVEIAREILGDSRVIARKAGNSIDIDLEQLTIQVLNPDVESVERGEVRLPHERNNISVVLQVQFCKHIVLLCGDIEQAAWENVVSRPEFQPPHVLKAPHHGAKSSAPPPTVLKHLTDNAWILLSTTSGVPDKPHASILEAFWTTQARTRCTGWSPHCPDGGQERCPAARGSVSWPESLRQAYLVRPPQRVLQAIEAVERICCADNELILDGTGKVTHSVARTWCDDGPAARHKPSP